MKAIELFAGAGGLGIGVATAGFKTVEVVEWDKWCCDTISQNRAAGVSPVASWPEPTAADVRSVDFGRWEGKLDLISGGPPCQPFSLGGRHRAFEDSRDMWPEAVRAVREAKPSSFVFENVKGLTRASFLNYFSYIKLQLEFPEVIKKPDEFWEQHLSRLEQHHLSGARHGLNYRVIAEVLNAANFGVPQKRERVVFVGVRDDLNLIWSFPKATHSSDALLWEQCRDWRYWDRHRVAIIDRSIDCRLENRANRLKHKPMEKPWQTVRDALIGLGEPKSNEDSQFLNHRLQTGARSYPGHTGSPLDEPAKTLKAGVHGVPGGENMLRLPDGTVRYFSVRESARLQTFPDNYIFQGAWSEAMRQLGNAVPVQLANVIAGDLRAKLSEKKRHLN